jgi:hypothetical protein
MSALTDSLHKQFTLYMEDAAHVGCHHNGQMARRDIANFRATPKTSTR